MISTIGAAAATINPIETLLLLEEPDGFRMLVIKNIMDVTSDIMADRTSAPATESACPFLAVLSITAMIVKIRDRQLRIYDIAVSCDIISSANL